MNDSLPWERGSCQKECQEFQYDHAGGNEKGRVVDILTGGLKGVTQQY